MKVESQNLLRRGVLERLKKVIDPETGADVIRMHLIEDLIVSDDGEVSYTFRPSSPLCPIAVYLVKTVKEAVSEVQGVTNQNITVTGYIAAQELTELINKEI